MIQLAILNTQGYLDIDSYMNYVLEDIKVLSKNGMRVMKNGKELFKKVTINLSMVSGDSVSVRSLSHMKMYNHEYPCMLCRIHREKHEETGSSNQLLIENQESAELRNISDFFHGDKEVLVNR